MEQAIYLVPRTDSELGTLVEEYLASCRARNLSPATIKNSYAFALRGMFLPWCYQEPITSIGQLDRRALDRFLSHLQDYKTKRGGSLSKHSIRSYVLPIRLFLTWASREGEEVKAKPQMPKAGKRQRDILSRSEIDRLEGAAPTERDKIIIRIFGDCGLRLNEVARLRVGDVIYAQNHASLNVRGKGDRDRRVPVPPALFRRMQRYIASRPETNSDSLFMSIRRAPYGDYAPLGGYGIAQLVRGVAERARFERPIHPHLLRHSWMTEMLRGGMNPIQLSVIAGASQQVIAANYEHLTEDDAHDSMMRVLMRT
jgi:integrase/recombinase XerD